MTCTAASALPEYLDALQARAPRQLLTLLAHLPRVYLAIASFTPPFMRSIFEGLLPEDLGVYATTAANSMESSWGTYCPGQRGANLCQHAWALHSPAAHPSGHPLPPPGMLPNLPAPGPLSHKTHPLAPPGMDPEPADGFDTCLGDLYSVAWMEDCEWEDLTKETLEVSGTWTWHKTTWNSCRTGQWNGAWLWSG